jgi:hypothetical protein
MGASCVLSARRSRSTPKKARANAEAKHNIDKRAITIVIAGSITVVVVIS